MAFKSFSQHYTFWHTGWPLFFGLHFTSRALTINFIKFIHVPWVAPVSTVSIACCWHFCLATSMLTSDIRGESHVQATSVPVANRNKGLVVVLGGTPELAIPLRESPEQFGPKIMTEMTMTYKTELQWLSLHHQVKEESGLTLYWRSSKNLPPHPHNWKCLCQLTTSWPEVATTAQCSQLPEMAEQTWCLD